MAYEYVHREAQGDAPMEDDESSEEDDDTDLDDGDESGFN